MKTLQHGLAEIFGFRRRGARRRCRRPSAAGRALVHEVMEPRIALAVYGFSQGSYEQLTDGDIFGAPVSRDGWAVIVGTVGTPSDDIYVQQVATSPQKLLFADNGSFNDTPGVDGDYGEIEGINSLTKLFITNADVRSDAGVLNNNYPVFNFTELANTVTTRFVLQHDDLTLSPVSGTIQYTQSDGRTDTWILGGNRVSLTVGGGPAARPGDLVPIFVSYVNPLPARSQDALEVTWEVVGTPTRPRTPGEARLSPFMSVPFLAEVTYTHDDESVGNSQRFMETGVRPSAAALVVNGVTQPTVFTLPNALGDGSAGIVAGTVSGTLFINGGAYPFHVDSATGNRLVFGGGVDFSTEEATGFEYLLQTASRKPLTVRGTVDFTTGTISLTFGSYLGATDFSAAAPGPVRLDVRYAVYTAGNSNGSAGSLTVFAGHDITTEVAVDLLAHGATINIDSPLVMRESLVGGDTSLRATNINIEAKLQANDRLDIGGSTAPRIAATRQAYAVAEIGTTGIQARQVINLFCPTGLEGAGYFVPPVVTIAGPNGQTNARLGTVTVDRDPASPTFGRVTGIQILDPGFGYLSSPPIVIQSPSVAGVTATATATLDSQGRVVGITITNGGSDYGTTLAVPVATIFKPQAEAQAILDGFGRISGFTITNPGSGYTARPEVTIAAPVAPRAAVLRVPVVPATFDLGPAFSTTVIRVLNGGYGYTSPPQVWIAPPPEGSDGTQATAYVDRADIDAEGRVLAVTISNPGSGYFTTDAFGIQTPFTPAVRILAPFPVPAAEVVNFDASVAANVFEIHVGDDTGTSRERGTMTVSQTGSLSRQFLLGAQADSIFVQAIQSDVLIEGTVWVDKQTYLMQSLRFASDLAPYVFTTTSPRTGASAGTIRGGTVGITLANDALNPADDGAVAFNDVDLHTDVDSFRIRAATSSGVTLSDPFPYELRVVEDNNIAFEAVAASSFPITLSAGQNMLFNASLATAGDLNIVAEELFTLSAPVSTTRGQIDVTARNVTVQNSLQVTNAEINDTRDDIVIEATGGNVRIDGLVSAVNNVVLRQANSTGPSSYDYSNRNAIPIADNATAALAITVGDAFTFQNLDVAIDLTHTFVGDLSAVLVAPDGTRIRLFTRIGGGGDNFTGTIFDSEAATPIAAGTAPYTGRFRPQDSLAPLYGRDARGTWRLEVTDSALTDIGSLTNFTLQFTSDQPVNGRISGTARVRADLLTIDAQGIVGNPDVNPSDNSFFLRTDVNSLRGRAGTSFSVNELNDIHVEDLRAGGLVSLRANGVDPAAGPNAGKAALWANLSDAPAIDVSAPAGSVEVVNNAPKTIILGNANALRLGTAASMLAAGNVTIRSSGGATRGEIYALDAPLAGSAARTARYLVGPLAGASYAARNPGTTPSTITGVGSLSGVLGLPSLRVNDRVLVAGGDQRNGLYRVANLGGAATSWILSRAADSDTAAEMPANTFVRVTDGLGAGIYQLSYTATTTAPFTLCPIVVTAKSLITNIGSDDPTDAATFVVSTAGTTNTAAGSLGKMMLLRQQNDTSASLTNPDQEMDFRFSSQVLTNIRLVEQLPLITKPFTIDGNASYNPPGSPGVNRPRITIDGSRITQTRAGGLVTTSSVVNGFEVSGAAASGAVLSNMTIAGFSKGAAVQVQDASTVLVNAVILGSTDGGVRVSNEYGLRVAGASSDVTLLRSTITANVKAGVRVEGSSAQVVLVGNTIGVADRDNGVGVSFASTGSNRLGVEPVLPLVAIPVVSGTRVNNTTFTLPASYRLSSALLFPGLGVNGLGIARPTATSPAAVVRSIATNATTGVTTITISGGTVNASGQVTFGNFAVTTLGGTSITLPASISPNSLYLGQLIAGDGLPTGTTITKIERSATSPVAATVTLSAPMIRSGLTRMTFPGPNNGAPRNTVQNNLTGVVLESGSTTIVNTTIINNALDGVRIQGGTNTVGRPDRSRSAFSNVIYGNGGFGIVMDVSGKPALANTRTNAVTLANSQVIRGNFLGVNVGNQSARLNAKGNIGLLFKVSGAIKQELYVGEPDVKYEPNTVTFIDAEGNQHNAPSRTGSGGSTPTTSVPPVPPRRR